MPRFIVTACSYFSIPLIAATQQDAEALAYAIYENAPETLDAVTFDVLHVEPVE